MPNDMSGLRAGVSSVCPGTVRTQLAALFSLPIQMSLGLTVPAGSLECRECAYNLIIVSRAVRSSACFR